MRKKLMVASLLVALIAVCGMVSPALALHPLLTVHAEIAWDEAPPFNAFMVVQLLDANYNVIQGQSHALAPNLEATTELGPTR